MNDIELSSPELDSQLLTQAICKKIKHQFPETPEAKLMFAIIERAILDLREWRYRHSAERYLAGQLREAELC